jgi:four helix bundle protein
MRKELLDNNPKLKLSIDFSLMLIDYCEQLEQDRKYIIAWPLLKSGTSNEANSMESQNAESKPDFIHKIKIAAKETDETQDWLLFCKHSKKYPDCKVLIEKLEEIQKVLNKILGTAKKRNPFSYFLTRECRWY